MTRPNDRRSAAPSARPTYQGVLDESLQETFPASDPIAAGAAANAGMPVETKRDATDWLIRPGSEANARQGGGSGVAAKAPAPRSAKRR